MPPRASTLWFPDVAPWPATDAAPARDLAAHLARFRAVDAAQRLSPPPATTLVVSADSSAIGVAETRESPAPSAAAAPASDLDAFLSDAERAVRERRRKTEKKSRRRRPPVGRQLRIAGAAAAALVIVATVVSIFVVRNDTDAAPDPVAAATPSETVTPSTTPVAQVPACTERPVNSSIPVSDDDLKGDQNSGPGAIRAFNHGYYVLRSARAARSVTSPGAVASEYVMQQYIDQRPMGTRHCLAITERGPGEYSVVLTELQPDAAPITYRQVVRTSTTGGKTFIDSIESVG